MRWVVLPVLLLPMMSAMAAGGWSGFRGIWSAGFADGSIGSSGAAAAAVHALIPLKLLGWTPHVNSFWMEAVSFTLRAVVVYLLFAGSWLVLAFVTSAGNPRLTQSSTVVSP